MENKGKYKDRGLVTGMAVLIVIILVVAFAGYVVSRPQPTVIQGEAEAAEYRVSGKVPGRIAHYYVSEGDMVSKGDTLVHIDSPEVMSKLAQATAVRSAARAQKDKAYTGARKEQIDGAFELWQQALAAEEIMKKSFDRVSSLYRQNVVSAQKYDEAEAQYKVAAARSAAAESQYKMAVNGARDEDKAAAEALEAQAAAAVQEVESYLGELFLTAPADGIVSARFPKCGELVGQGAPVMCITDLRDCWFTFNVREELLSSFRAGDYVYVRIPALGGQVYRTKVTYISALESYATWRAAKDTGGYDSRTFEVRTVPDVFIEGLRPGMTAIVDGL